MLNKINLKEKLAKFSDYWAPNNHEIADTLAADGSLIPYVGCEKFNDTYIYIISDTSMTLTSSNATIKFLKP